MFLEEAIPFNGNCKKLMNDIRNFKVWNKEEK